MNPINIVGGALGLYRVVPANEAHVRILFDKKEVFASKKELKDKVGVEVKPDYWYVPFGVTKVQRLPLTNLRIDVPDVKLNDKNMAKFMCDIVCFVNISDPMLAVERTTISLEKDKYEERALGYKDIAEDFRAIMESVGRTVATKQTILDIYMDRSTLDNAVTKEVEAVFPKWGLELVDLEIKDVKDVPGSTIIQDIEKKIAATISADARVKIAEEGKRATISEAENQRAAEVRRAEMEEEYRKRQIEKERTLAVAEQDKVMQAAKKEQEANAQYVEAQRTKTVGLAQVKMQETIQLADAEKEKLTRVAAGEASKIKQMAEATAQQTKQVGEAEAAIIKAKKVADAEGTEKQALAQQKFNDAATSIEVIHATKEIGLAQAAAAKEGLSRATINIVSGETKELVNGGLLGKIALGPAEGIALKQFLTAANIKPEDVTKLIETFKAKKSEDGAK